MNIAEIAEKYDINEIALNKFYENDSDYFDNEDEEVLISHFEQSFRGYFDSHEDFILDYICMDEVPDFIIRYIDYTQFWESDLRHDYWESDGYYFRSDY